MKIYVVSFEDDVERKRCLMGAFIETYREFIFINAVKGRELNAGVYYDEMTKRIRVDKRIMSPSEYGCTLSHMDAYQKLINSGEDYALILEDDVVGYDEDILRIKKMMSFISTDSVLICGGQDGLNNTRYVYGKKTEVGELFEIYKPSLRYLLRTCCYVIGKDAAKKIIEYQKGCPQLADDWSLFNSVCSVNIFYSNILSHPICLVDSYIEKERNMRYGKSDDIFCVAMSVFNKIKIIFIREMIVLSGCLLKNERVIR